MPTSVGVAILTSRPYPAQFVPMPRAVPGEISPSRIVMIQIINGITFCISQSVEHPLRWFPANFPVGSHVPHRVAGLFELGEELGDESMPALGERRIFSLLARDIYPEFQLFCHPQFHFFQPVRTSYCASN
jgi:hypothetical protein